MVICALMAWPSLSPGYRRIFSYSGSCRITTICWGLHGSYQRTKMIWSREEDIQHGRYRPVALVRMKASLDASGAPTAWYVRQADQSIFNDVAPERIKNGIDTVGVRTFSDAPYAFPNIHMEYAMRNTPVPPGPLRAVAHTHNPFFRESFIDEVAVAAGQDPYQFRRKLLTKATKDLGILDAVAKAAIDLCVSNGKIKRSAPT